MIEFSNVTKVYKKGPKALDHVSMTIDDGEFVFITGRSGAGKSTMIHLLTCEDVATEGEVLVDGVDLKKLSRRQIPYYRRKIGVVFQDFRLINDLNVFDNVAFAMRVVGSSHSRVRQRVKKVLEIVGLSHKLKAYPEQLSGGEQQRVALARAIVNNPGLIIADEPTGNVDPLMSVEIMKLLMKINSLGICVLVVTHEQALVKRFSKREIRIEQGHIVFDSSQKDESESSAYQSSDPVADADRSGPVRKGRRYSKSEEEEQ